jgi:hypothetical protein
MLYHKYMFFRQEISGDGELNGSIFYMSKKNVNAGDNIFSLILLASTKH